MRLALSVFVTVFLNVFLNVFCGSIGADPTGNIGAERLVGAWQALSVSVTVFVFVSSVFVFVSVFCGSIRAERWVGGWRALSGWVPPGEQFPLVRSHNGRRPAYCCPQLPLPQFFALFCGRKSNCQYFCMDMFGMLHAR